MLNIAFVINASIMNNNKILNGTSLLYKKKYGIFEQVFILLNSIKKHIKSFKYKIFLFTTVKYSKINLFFFEKIFNCVIFYVDPDLNDESYKFICKSKCFTTDIGNFTHRIHLDADMFFVKEPKINFDYDILLTYMPDWITHNNDCIKLFDKFKKYFSNCELTDKCPLLKQYNLGRNYIKINPPLFNGGCVIIKEKFSKKFGLLRLKYYEEGLKNQTINCNALLYSQNHLSIVVNSITNNWSSTPIGVNYFGHWENIIDTNKFIDKISLIHYIGIPPTYYNKYNLYDKMYEFVSCKIYNNEIIPEVKELIINLKEEEWNYGLKSQNDWFNKNIKLNDKHFLIFNFKKLIGYGLLRYFEKYSILDTIIVNKNFRGNGFGKKIVSNLIKNENNPIFLLCENKNINFYSKIGFKINNEIEIIDRKKNKNLNIMNINNSTLKKIKYYHI